MYKWHFLIGVIQLITLNSLWALLSFTLNFLFFHFLFSLSLSFFSPDMETSTSMYWDVQIARSSFCCFHLLDTEELHRRLLWSSKNLNFKNINKKWKQLLLVTTMWRFMEIQELRGRNELLWCSNLLLVSIVQSEYSASSSSPFGFGVQNYC